MRDNCEQVHPRAITASPYRPSETIENRHQKLIALLATGHTDASAARQLGVSRRTVTYMLRSMMDELGINNRFQLGIAVGARSRSCETCPEPGRSGGTDIAHEHGRY
nr:LuxR family transcription regulator [Streptomyces sp.]